MHNLITKRNARSSYRLARLSTQNFVRQAWQTTKRASSVALVFSAVAAVTLPFNKVVAKDLNLPQLGSAGSTAISPAREKKLGRLWQRSFQGSVAVDDDLILSDYLQDLTKQLALAGGLTSLDLSVMTVTDDSLNAFAVPGGVVGIHTGLLRHAKTIDQLASVLAHELAHVTQRHFARRLEENKRNNVKYLAALLASVAIAAGGGAEAGIAAISATQAASIDSQLRFSRSMEREADRLGLDIMRRAGFDQRGMAEMFENMLSASRYYRKPPAFLLSHPVTENRVADARLRIKEDSMAKTFAGERERSRERHYQWMRQHARLLEDDPSAVVAQLVGALELTNGPVDPYKQALTNLEQAPSDYLSAFYYGYALALYDSQDYVKSLAVTTSLCEHYTNFLCRILSVKNKAELEHKDWQAEFDLLYVMSKRQADQARGVALAYANTLLKKRRYAESVDLLEDHVVRFPESISAWYILAEAQGLIGNILGVHKARAEFFLLTGRLESAALQLNYAMEKAEGKPFEKAWVEQRLRVLRQIEKDVDELS